MAKPCDGVPLRYAKKRRNKPLDLRKNNSQELLFNFISSDNKGREFGVSPITIVKLSSDPKFARICLEGKPWPQDELPIAEEFLKAAAELPEATRASLNSAFAGVCSLELPRRHEGEDRDDYWDRVNSHLRRGRPTTATGGDLEAFGHLSQAIQSYCKMRVYVLPDYLEATFEVLTWLLNPKKGCFADLPAHKTDRPTLHTPMLRVYQACEELQKADNTVAANATALAALAILNGHYALHETEIDRRSIGENELELTDTECPETKITVTIRKKPEVSGVVASPERFRELWANVKKVLKMEHSSADWRFQGPTILEHFTTEARLGRQMAKSLEENFTSAPKGDAKVGEIFTKTRMLQPDRASKLTHEQDPFLSQEHAVFIWEDAVKLATLHIKKGKPFPKRSFTWPSLNAGTKRFYSELDSERVFKIRPHSKLAEWNLKKRLKLNEACRLIDKLPGTSSARQNNSKH